MVGLNLVLGVIVVAAIVEIVNPCPTIVPRSQWSQRRSTLRSISTPVPHVFIHHTESAGCTNRQSCVRMLRSFQALHVGKGWGEIGYNFLIGGDGVIYEGRGWGKGGAHTRGYNSNAIAISFIGSFKTRAPSAAMVRAAQALIQCGVSRRQIQSGYGLYGHRDANATDCPGNSLYSLIKRWARYGAKGRIRRY